MAGDQACESLRRDGTRCHARALAGSRFCFSHDPARAPEREAALTRGVVKVRETFAARRARRQLVPGTFCPRCASPDVNPHGKGMPESWTCRVCGHHF
jgi:hypothetical protein